MAGRSHVHFNLTNGAATAPRRQHSAVTSGPWFARSVSQCRKKSYAANVTAALGAALRMDGMAPLNRPANPSRTAMSCTTCCSVRTASGATRCNGGRTARANPVRVRHGCRSSAKHLRHAQRASTCLAVTHGSLQACHLEPLLGDIKWVRAQLGQHARGQATDKGLHAAGRLGGVQRVQSRLRQT